MNKIQRLRLISAIIVLNFIVTVPVLHAQLFKVQVDAGAFDRKNTVVDFRLPTPIEPGNYSLVSQGGDILPLQVDQDNTGWFILPSLDAQHTAEFEIHKESHSQQQQDSAPHLSIGENAVSIKKDKTTIEFVTFTGSVLRYFYGENSPPEELDERYKRGGYIHPIFSPAGHELTNHLNAQQHPHHAGIWSAWTNTLFDGSNPDFWNLHRNSGRVDIDTLLHFWEGPVTGGFFSRHSYFDLTGDEPKIALNELWEVRVYASPLDAAQPYHIFDIIVTQTTNTDRPLLLPEYRYGGIGFRGNKEWDDPLKSDFLTSEGLGRDGNAQRARWVHMGGYIGDNLAGFAIMGHPINYRFPQPARIHPSEPFFNFAPTQMGDMSIQPGIPYVTKFRIVTSDGEPDADLIDNLWNDYAYPPGVSIIVK
ncbi:MAG: PmoA family protein [Balneolales bacterium]|nr:PmoA family protein [Balneolales bacterium]